MSDENQGWGGVLADKWTNYYPPCRVSNSELVLYSEALKGMREKFQDKKIKVLILGSTSEFRDWAHEEALDTTVIDFSERYYKNISKQMKYKNVQETVVNCLWQEMDFEDKFHIVVGDLVVGNVKESELSVFLRRVNSALVEGGLFLTKSFFVDSAYKLKSLESIFKENPLKEIDGNAFSKYIYDIAMCCVNRNSNILEFSHMYRELRRMKNEGVIDEHIFSHFKNLGWQDNMKFGFYMPTKEHWEELLSTTFSCFFKHKSKDVYSEYFDIYRIVK